MNKQFIFLGLGFIILLFVLFLAQEQIANEMEIGTLSIYLFHGIFSIAISTALYFLSEVKKFSSSIGFFYMGTFILKAILFFILFGSTVFSKSTLTNKEALILLIPLFIAIIFEVLFLIKILSKIDKVKND